MRPIPHQHKPAATRQWQRLAMALLAASLCQQVLLKTPNASARPTEPTGESRTLGSGSGEAAGAARALDAVTPVSAVDLQRFLGEWFEIARIPAWFQNRCFRDTTARYELRGDGRITVINRCITRKGETDQAKGLARVMDPASKARLQVSFVNLLGWRPFWGDYWIIALDPEYRWLVVGDPKRQYGWILSRSRVMDPAMLEEAFQGLERNGYSRSRFVLTPQS